MTISLISLNVSMMVETVVQMILTELEMATVMITIMYQSVTMTGEIVALMLEMAYVMIEVTHRSVTMMEEIVVDHV